MKRCLVLCLGLAAAVLWLQTTDVSAEAFSNVGFSAEAMGRADAVIASIDDAAAMWYNPAKAAWLEGNNIQLNIDNIYPYAEHTPLSTDLISTQKFKNERGLAQLGSLFYTYKPSFMDAKWTFGLGINSPYGLASFYPRSASVAPISYKARLTTINYNLNAAYAINDKMAVALGLDYMYWDGYLKLIHPLLGNGDVLLDFGTEYATGVNAAFAWKITDKDSLGLTFRSQMRIKADDCLATITGGSGTYANLLRGTSKFSSNFNYPDEYGIGWSRQLNEKILAEISGIWRNWNDYDFVPYNKEEANLIGNTFFTSGAGVKNYWKNGGLVALGMKYMVSEKWNWTAGYQYHQDPVNEYYDIAMMPDTPQHAISGGINYKLGGITISPSFLYGTNMKKDINAPGRVQSATANYANIDGEWDVQVYHFNLGASYKF